MAPLRELDLESKLNPEQIAAVTHGEGPQLVLAGAGSGKTRVITYRIYHLVEARGVDPGHIAAMTFTNKAAAEMRERVEELLGVQPLPTFVGTFHRFAILLLRRYGERVGLKRDFAIHDAADQTTLVKEALAAEGLAETSFSPRSMLAQISAAKNRLIEPPAFEAAAQSFLERKVAGVYRRYQGLLHQASGVDFDDLITLSVKLLATDAELRQRVRGRARYLMVDEYQDTNHAQLRLIEELAGGAGNLTAVGDEDQGIYRWRGADLDNILNFEHSFPDATVRKLERNYRSTQTILDVSGALIDHNVNRRGKRLWTDRGAGDKVTLYRAGDEVDEARWVADTLLRERSRVRLAEMAILVRTNAQTRALEEELLKREIPYSLVGGVRFYDRAEIKDLVAYLRVLRNPRDNFSLSRIFNQPPRGIGKTTLEMLRDQASALGQPLWDVLYLDELGALPARSAAAVRRFRDLITGLMQAAAELPLPALLDRLLADTRYADLYRQDDAEDQARLENIRELLSAAQAFTETSGYVAGRGAGRAAGNASWAAGAGAANDYGDADLLTAFLDHISLVSDLDSHEEGRGVSLMTLHSAKGLEFRTVIVAGLEDGLLPHFNSKGLPDNVEEERRLLYVGMTRAKERLYLTACRRRRIAGRYQDQSESPFLAELPGTLLEVRESQAWRAAERYDPRAQAIAAYFGDDSERARRSEAGQASRWTEESRESQDSPPSRWSPPGERTPWSPQGGRSGRPGGAGLAAPRLSPGTRGGGARAGLSRLPGERTVVHEIEPAVVQRPLKRGSRVRHPTLGQGVVLELDGHGEDAKVTVYFDRTGKRKLIARFANLEML
jgi:DNA helicase-2/ATP-dependent DNA helicase PcrA